MRTASTARVDSGAKQSYAKDGRPPSTTTGYRFAGTGGLPSASRSQNPMKSYPRLLALCSLGSLACLSLPSARAGEGDWPNWRGPHYNGTSDAKGFPETFSKTENVKWVADLGGDGASSPVTWGNFIFLTAASESQGGTVAICLDRATGKELWSRKFGEGVRQDERSNFAAPSAVTDGERVYFFTGSGELAAFTLGGEPVWNHNIQKEYGPFAFQWTFSTSPVLSEGQLILQVLQRDVAAGDRGFKDRKNDSYLVAFDPKTGQELWKHIRPAEAVQESLEAFSTPLPVEIDGQKQLVVIGGDCITGHEAGSGKELWRWGTWNPGKIAHWRLVPSPVFGDGVFLACAPKNSPIFAVKAGLKGKADDETALRWTIDEKGVTSDVPTPAFYQGRFYVLNEGGKFINCIDPATGRIVWKERLNATQKLEASPTIADGRLYLISHRAEVFVVQTGDEFKLLLETSFGENETKEARAPIIPSHGNLLIRVNEKLYCVGK